MQLPTILQIQKGEKNDPKILLKFQIVEKVKLRAPHVEKHKHDT